MVALAQLVEPTFPADGLTGAKATLLRARTDFSVSDRASAERGQAAMRPFSSGLCAADSLAYSAVYSASIPADFTMRPHFCDSPTWNFASSSGDVVNNSVPVGS